MNTDKLILTDVDGCLLWWEQGFHNWMEYRGHNKANIRDAYWMWDHYPHLSEEQAKRHVEEYNGSSWMLGLPAYEDARIGVATLVNAGYTFHAITSMGTDPYSKELRMMNLERLFGTEAFVKLTVTEMYETKEEALSPYRDSRLFWLEDKWENAVLGADMGLTSIIFDHPHNTNNHDDRITRAKDWNRVCDYILNPNISNR